MKIYKEIHPTDNNYIKLEKLRAATWNGIPESIPQMRCQSWKLLLDYTPIDTGQLESTLERKRQEYYDIVNKYFGDFDNTSVANLVQDGQSKPVHRHKLLSLSEFEKKNFKQIKIDVLRTQPDLKVFACEQMQSMLIRILFTWAVRHPASGYVQGINDLCAPLLLVFLSEYVMKADINEDQLY